MDVLETFEWVAYTRHRTLAETHAIELVRLRKKTGQLENTPGYYGWKMATYETWMSNLLNEHVSEQRSHLEGIIGCVIMLLDAIVWRPSSPPVAYCACCGRQIDEDAQGHSLPPNFPTMYSGNFALADIILGPKDGNVLFAIVDPSGKRLSITKETSIFLPKNVYREQRAFNF